MRDLLTGLSSGDALYVVLRRRTGSARPVEDPAGVYDVQLRVTPALRVGRLWRWLYPWISRRLGFRVPQVAARFDALHRIVESHMHPPEKEPEAPPGAERATPLSYEFGQNIDWDAELTPVVLFVELPFWLMTPSATFEVCEAECTYSLDVVDNFGELLAGEVLDSRGTSIYIGPMEIERVAPQLREELEQQQIPALWRPCKTVVRIHSRANTDVLDAVAEQETSDPRLREAQYYLRALCEAHLPILNRLIQGYRLNTYDFFAHEVSPWDVPIWYVHRPKVGSERVVLFDYATWDRKPQIGPLDGELHTYRLTIPPDLQEALDSLAPGRAGVARRAKPDGTRGLFRCRSPRHDCH